MEIAITTMSSKGQIVIPVEMRQGIIEGDKILLIKNQDQLILKKATDVEKLLNDELAFARRTEAALKNYQKGKFKRMEFDDFILEMKKW